jgi:hypothetical protein
MRIAVSTALSNSWRFIKQKLYFVSACDPLALRSCKSNRLLCKGRAKRRDGGSTFANTTTVDKQRAEIRDQNSEEKRLDGWQKYDILKNIY